MLFPDDLGLDFGFLELRLLEYELIDVEVLFYQGPEFIDGVGLPEGFEVDDDVVVDDGVFDAVEAVGKNLVLSLGFALFELPLNFVVLVADCSEEAEARVIVDEIFDDAVGIVVMQVEVLEDDDHGFELDRVGWPFALGIGRGGK